MDLKERIHLETSREDCIASLLSLDGDNDFEHAHQDADKALLVFLENINELAIIEAYQHIKECCRFQYA